MTSIAFFACAAVLPARADLAGFLELWAQGRSNERFLLSQVAAARSESARGTDPVAIDRLLLGLLQGSTPAELRAAGQRLCRGSARSVAVTARMQRHRGRGDLVVLVSGLPEPCVRPLAATGPVDALLAVQLITDDAGRHLGAPADLFTGAAGRADLARGFATSRGLELADCHAYGSTPRDLPLLAEAGRATVVGDHPVLVAAANRAGWCVTSHAAGAALAASA